MNKLLSTALSAFLYLSPVAMVGQGESGLLSVDAKSSSLFWEATKVAGSHSGNLRIKEGSMELKNGQITSAVVAMDMGSITVTDIKDAETNAKLVGHLKSEDFFSSADYPTSTFILSRFAPLAGDKVNNYEISGTLTIKGITNPISFPAKVDIKGKKVSATGKLTFDRTKWDIRYNSGSFFDGLGDYMIFDDVSITFRLTAK